MKSRFSALIALLLVVAGMSFACTRKIAVDTSNLDYSFQTADATNQTAVTAAIDDIEKKKYDAALEKLNKVAAETNLTAEQKSAVQAVIEKMPKR